MLIFSQVLSMMVGIRMFGPQQVRGRLQRHTVSDASEVVGQLHAANTKCIENFSLLKPQNLMKQSMTCTLKIHEVFIMFVLFFISWLVLKLLVPQFTIAPCVCVFVDIVAYCIQNRYYLCSSKLKVFLHCSPFLNLLKDEKPARLRWISSCRRSSQSLHGWFKS